MHARYGWHSRGRPRLEIDGDIPEAPPLPLPPLTPIERKAFDYTALEEAMAHLDAVVRSSRIALRSLAEGRTGTRAEPAADSAEAAPN